MLRVPVRLYWPLVYSLLSVHHMTELLRCVLDSGQIYYGDYNGPLRLFYVLQEQYSNVLTMALIKHTAYWTELNKGK